MTGASNRNGAALSSYALLVYQRAFFDGRVQVFADFLFLGDSDEYEAWDSKLVRSSKSTAAL